MSFRKFAVAFASWRATFWFLCFPQLEIVFLFYQDWIRGFGFDNLVTLLSCQKTWVKNCLVSAKLAGGFRIWICKDVFTCTFSHLAPANNFRHNSFFLYLSRNLNDFLLIFIWIKFYAWNVLLIFGIGRVNVLYYWASFISIWTWACAFWEINVSEA